MGIKEMARAAGIPEISSYLDGLSEPTIKSVEQFLHDIVAMSAHPSKGYGIFAVSKIIDSIASEIYPYSSADYIKMLVLYRISYYSRTVGDLTTVGDELRVLSVVWGLTEDAGKLDKYDFLDEVVEDWDWQYLKDEFLSIEPGDESIENVAGRALHYKDTGRMDGTVSAHEVRKVFGWVK